ncbi:unnamed protein product [Litomosoides sigmodontis]|uniref:Uncharacterized protein n=1 Tax=Litomosoides sigmodontis TaxID=42156 RepID=A0A3P6US02_LITSI|nr:unnamed protein product [Litomosoides sigmodontis]
MGEERRATNSNPHLAIHIKHLQGQQSGMKKLRSISSSDILAANDFFSVFDEILLHNSLCGNNNSHSSSCHPKNCCLCNQSSSDFHDPLDATILLPVSSSSTTDFLCANFEEANSGADLDENSDFNDSSRRGDGERGGKLRIPSNCLRIRDALRKKSQIYLKLLSTRKALRKCENCCHSLKSACKSFFDSTCITLGTWHL